MTMLTRCNYCEKVVPDDADAEKKLRDDCFFNVSHWGEQEHIEGDICFECMEREFSELYKVLQKHDE